MPAADGSVKATVMSLPVEVPAQVGWLRFAPLVVTAVADLAGPSTTSVPTLRSGLHWLAAQAVALLHARSAQSMRPLPSSSLPLLQTSGWLLGEVESVTCVAAGVPG